METLADEIGRLDRLDGVTVTGGEPLEQHDALLAFCRRLKARRPALDLLIYTGWRLEELERRFPGGELLEVIDGLVDGPFVETEHDDSGWRGSGNQRYFQIVGGRALERPGGYVPGPWSVAVEPDGTLFMTGIPRRGELARLYAELRRAGIVVREA